MIESGKIEDAIIFLEKAFEADPEDEEVIEKLNDLYPEIGAPELGFEADESEEGGKWNRRGRRRGRR